MRTGRGDVLLDHRARDALPAASMGKLLLLIEVADRLATGVLDPHLILVRAEVEPVGGSGLWQHLSTASLPVGDLAALVGACSDNLATNALLAEIGFDAVEKRRRRLGLRDVALHDLVRDVRGLGHPPALSTASAAELVGLCERIAADDVAAPGTGSLVRRWLSFDVDTSMVAGGLGLDPLAHVDPDRDISLWHKTGTDAGVRADAGVVVGPADTVTYAALGAWTPTRRDVERDLALRTMRRIGSVVRAAATGTLT